MILTLLLAASLRQVQQAPPPAAPPRAEHRTIVRDSSTDSIRNKNDGRRLPVTASVLASAFKTPATRDLFEKARRARIAQDSAIRNYDAIARQRLSVNLGIGSVGRDHLMYRQEVAARVQWQHDVGAVVDLTGARVGIPMASKADEIDDLLGELNSMSPIPYYPGYEALWLAGDDASAKVEANDRDIVNPLTVGAEAYYTYAIADSASFTLQTGEKIRLREIEVRPRSPSWNLTVGSFWFDDDGKLVKCVYRLAVPLDMWTMVDDQADSTDKVPAAVRGLISPMRLQVTAVAIEYSLMEGRFWLPRLRSMTGDALVVFARVPMTFDQRFEYTSVNGPDRLTPIDSTKLPPLIRPEVARARRDSVRAADSTRKIALAGMTLSARAAASDSIRRYRDSVSTRRLARADSIDRSRNARMRAVADSLERGLPAVGAQLGTRQGGSMCDSLGVRTVYTRRFESRMPVAVRIPCNLGKLINSPDLPPSIYDSGEELFGTKERDEMVAQALTLGAQAPLSLGALPKPTYMFGLPMTRYNRVEGISTGLQVNQEFGAGLSATGVARFGLADKDPNVELTVRRSNLTKTIHVSGYHRLAVANDWGNPLSFGSSFSALLFGKDEGFYYRTTGAEVGWARGVNSKVEWRLFAENQKTASVNTQMSLVHRSSTDTFPANIVAAEGGYFGGALHLVHNHGQDPRGFRSFTDVKLEAARGDSLYGRLAAEIDLSHGLIGRSIGGITIAGGTSAGALPPQRLWYLGGTQTVRGQSADIAQSGNAFVLSRLELARDNGYHRSSLFGDLGWAGSRDSLYHFSGLGRPLAGVGYGESMFDGILRMDLARGLYPRKQWRFDVYLEARF